jgi:hypothetical protein
MRNGTILLVCVLILIGASSGVAQAQADQQPVSFSILGDTTGIGAFQMEGCRFSFLGLTAAGSAEGDLAGAFAYRENGRINLCFRYGVNEGLMTVFTDSGSARIGFRGSTDMVNVRGLWELKGGTGDYATLSGNGEYLGDARWADFTVTFTGSFYVD